MGSGTGQNENVDSLEEIVGDYTHRFRDDHASELSDFADADEPAVEVIARAARARLRSGEKLSHQRRISIDVLDRSADRLTGNVGHLVQSSDFEVLHERVAALIGDIRGIGDLAVYDTALRIGARLGLTPGRVYLHSGTRIGARRLGLRSDVASLSVDEVPLQLRQLTPREIEDVLCIYKDVFSHTTRVQASRSCGQASQPPRSC